MRPFKFALHGSSARKAVLISLVLLSPLSTYAADATPDFFNMLVISDQASGKQLLSGEVTEAIDKLNRPALRHERFAAANNLCVAYVRAQQPEKAMAACKRAVDRSRFQSRRDKAVALSNLGVVRALVGDTEGARHSFEAAIRLHGELVAPVRNLARLETRTLEAVA